MSTSAGSDCTPSSSASAEAPLASLVAVPLPSYMTSRAPQQQLIAAPVLVEATQDPRDDRETTSSAASVGASHDDDDVHSDEEEGSGMTRQQTAEFDVPDDDDGRDDEPSHFRHQHDGHQLHEQQYCCNDSDDESAAARQRPTFGFTAKEVHQQQAEVRAEKKETLQNEIANLQTSASTSVPAFVRIRVLLAEGARNEISRILKCASEGLLTPALRNAAIADVRLAYRSLISEVQSTMAMRRAQGCTPADEQTLCQQAVIRFASLYPWADSVLCDLPPAEAVALCARRQAARGQTGKLVPLSLGSTPACSQAKNAEANAQRQHVLLELEARRRRAAAERAGAMGSAGSASTSTSASNSPSSTPDSPLTAKPVASFPSELGGSAFQQQRIIAA